MTELVNRMTLLALVTLAVAVAVCFVRLLRGPTFADRVLAVDLATIAGAGLLAVAGIRFDDSMFLDVALILLVAGFVATAAFAQLIAMQRVRSEEQERAERPQELPPPVGDAGRIPPERRQP
jgi:multicomponent Na+:H+ antiporter subunit F